MLMSPATASVELQASRAITFPTDGLFAEVPDATTLDLGAEWTIEAWIRPAAVGSAVFQQVVSKWGIADAAAYALEVRDSRLRAVVRQGSQNTVIESAQVLSDGLWYHVAVTMGSGSIRLFVNGQLVAETTSLTPQTTTTPLTFGREAVTGLWPFRGSLDEVRIWGVAKSAQELQAGMNVVVTMPANGLLGYWRFDEPNGQVLYDLSGSGNNGTLGASDAAEALDAQRIDSDSPVQ